jgi:hypothetical protein
MKNKMNWLKKMPKKLKMLSVCDTLFEVRQNGFVEQGWRGL